MSSSAQRSARKPRQTKSCNRCRKRKIRCDFQQPACGACSAAGATCLDFDAVQGVEKPRDAVAHLENEVAQLEAELVRRQGQTLNVSSVANTIATNLAADVAAAILMPSSKPERLPPLSSAFFLSNSPAPYTMADLGQLNEHAHIEESLARPTALASIPRQVVDALLTNYCQNYRHHYPSVEEPDLWESCQKVYEQAQPSDYDVFSVHTALAISMQTLMNFDEKKATTATYGFWSVAQSHLPQVGTTSSWERLQALQLLTHYAFLNPKHVDCSKTAAAGMRLCLQLGLHHELPASEQAKLPKRTLNMRRRLFWNSYSLDAAVHSALCRPYMWPRSTFTTQFPDVDWHVSPAPHFWLLREIESEITVAMYHPSLGLDDMLWNASFDQWFARTSKRLNEWYQTTRENVSIGEKLEYHEMHYHTQVLRLNRPSPRCPRPTDEMRRQALRAGMTLVRGFAVFEHTGRLYPLWYAAHYLTEAGVCLLALVLSELESTEVHRGTHLLLDEDISLLSTCIKTCADLLQKIARRWPCVLGHAAAIEDVSQSVLRKLELWKRRGRQQSADLEDLKTRLNLLSQFPPLPAPTADDDIPQDATMARSAISVGNNDGPKYPPRAGGGGTPQQQAYVTTAEEQEAYDPFLTGSDEAAVVWDFAGLGGDEIFAALLEDQGSFMLNNNDNDNGS